MSEPRANARRPRKSVADSGVLDRLRANKAKLDAERAERERREEEALTTIAAQWSRIEELKRVRDKKLEELQRAAAQLRAETKKQIEVIERQQANALTELHEAGRTADEIAALVELPKDRVRKALRAAKPAGADAARSSSDKGGDTARASGAERQQQSANGSPRGAGNAVPEARGHAVAAGVGAGSVDEVR